MYIRIQLYYINAMDFFFLLKAIAIHERNPCFWTPNIDLLDVSVIKSRGKESRDETVVIPTMK